MHRMRLVDFWFYVNEEFLFKDGHMLLRGSNGSGKSVTMQSFIPLLLDGNKSSERLDSFGTRSRKIENYLIEEDGDRDDRIGYLYLEFKREDADVYKTIGIGLHARRNKPVDAWYFVIEDNQRINIDVQLMDHDLALTKQMLKNRLGSQVMESQKEYMDRVNTALFGFPTRDDYKEAITLLMQLRSPKLSNSLKPTIINEILSNSLQPLSEDDLRPMSEAIANMDEIKDQLDALKQSYISAKSIASIYDQYNHVVLDSKALAYLQKEKMFMDSQATIKTMQLDIEQNKQKQADAIHSLQQLRMEQSVLDEEKSSLVKQDVLQLAEDVERHKEEVALQKVVLATKEKQEEEKDNQRIDVKNHLQKQQDKKDQSNVMIQKVFASMDELQETLEFEEHQALRDEVLTHLECEYEYAYTEKRMKEEITSLQEGLDYFQTIQGIERQKSRYVDERETFIMQKEEAEKTLLEYQRLFLELQDEYKEKFATWNKQNIMLKISDEKMLAVFNFIQLFETENCYGDIEAMIHELYFKQYQNLTLAKSELELSFKQIGRSLIELQNEIDEWTNRKDPTPEMDDFMKANRAHLCEQKIAHTPLYKMLDYASDVPSDVQNHFEELLLRSGLLNALVVHVKDKERIIELNVGSADYYLFTDQDVNTYEAIHITRKISEEHDIASLLKLLHIQTGKIQGYDTYFENDVFMGTISKQVETIYIGELSRERYRATKLAQLQKALLEMEQEKAKIENQLNDNLQGTARLEEEYHKYPREEDLALAKQQIIQGEKDIEVFIKRIYDVKQEIDKMDQEIRLEKRKITSIADSLGILSTYAVFLNRKENFEEYASHIQNLKDYHKAYISSHELYGVLHIQLEDLQQDVDVLRAECSDGKRLIEKLNMRILQKEKQLSSLGYDDVLRRLKEIQDRLHALPRIISEEDQSVGNLSRIMLQLQADILRLEEEQSQHEIEKQITYEQYLNEVKLKYVIHEESMFEQVKSVHRLIEKAYPDGKRKDTLANDLQTSFYLNRGVLQDYNLSRITLFEEHEDTSRIDITARYQGIRITFFELFNNLQKDIDKQSVLLEDSDRALIEDILVNTISKKIRTHIQNSKRWVEVMNRYMNAMNTSSGLNLNLQWKSHKAESEEELNSEKLVELLEKDVRILKDVDRKRLSSHFRSKITTARKLSEQQDSHVSFHQVMKNVMDYRTWFDFRILSQKTGEKKRELTNTAFYAFSGGEKAMTMYIPLFSAVAAKFEGAREDAPLLIALDEAFAGVDEKNINNMFDLIGKFKFDYIMNSQVLWGDYPSVKGLAIHELFRPENARFVTVISYEWNGHLKKMVERS